MERDVVRAGARASLRAGDTLRLVLAAAGTRSEVEAALGAARRGRAQAQAWRGVLSRLRADGLTLATPDPALGPALEREKARLEARVVDAGDGRFLLAGRPGTGGEVAALAAVRRAAEGLLAGGVDAARDVLLYLGARQDVAGLVPGSVRLDGQAPSSGDGETTLHWLLLAASYLAWTSDLATVRAEWKRVRRGSIAVLESDARAAFDPGLVAAAARGLARAAEVTGDADGVRSLRRVADDPGAALAGSAAPPGSFAPAGSGAAREGGQGEEPDVWALRRAARLLGVEPDAARARIVLRPRPPRPWPWFRVGGLSMGDASIGLDYERTGGVHAFRVRQERGPVPVRLVLEPELVGRLERAHVDGEPARLSPLPAGGRNRVPVQLALDHERVLELEMDGA